jgi:hypothetical protein
MSIDHVNADAASERCVRQRCERTTDAQRLAAGRESILKHLQETCLPASPLLRLWECSYVAGAVLVLPAEGAIRIAETDPLGYHCGVWRLAYEYETLMAKGLLVNSNANALGFQQPKSFSAWPRRHDVRRYRAAADFRRTLSPDILQVSCGDRAAYRAGIREWHQSIQYVSTVSGHTRLDGRQLEQLCVALLIEA